MKASTSFFLILLAIGFSLVWAYFIYIPSWKVFLGLPGFWWPAIGLVVGTIVLGAINIPIFIEIEGVKFAVNVLGFLTPIAVIIYYWHVFEPSMAPLALIPFVLSAGLYLYFSKAGETGIEIPILLLYALALVDVLFLHYVAELPVREVMWYGFAIQYLSLLVMDFFRGFGHAGQYRGTFKMLSFGGAGGRDALWSGPNAVLVFAYLMQDWIWEGIDETLLLP